MSTYLPKTAADFKQALNIQVIAGDTTAELSSRETVDGDNLPDGLYGFTIDGDNQYKEYIICTLSGTALSAVYSVDALGVATSGFANYHRKGASVEITDWAVLFRILQNLTAQVGFDSGSPLFYDAAPSLGSSNQFATVQYVLDHINGGAVSFNAEVISGMAGETISSGQWVYLKESDGRWYKTDATDTTKCLGVKIGKALGAGTAGNAIANGVFVHGLETAGSYAAFTSYYLSDTAGALSTSTGTNSVLVGVSDGNSKLLVGEIGASTQNALAGGGTFGTPSSSNKFATEAYITAQHKFGGTGADGALSVSSGTTNIDLGSAAVVIKNYTSISITGTAAITFSNPHANGTVVIFKSQGNVTITSSASPAIDLRLMGAAGGADSAGTGQSGNAGTGQAGQDPITSMGAPGTGVPAAGAGGTRMAVGSYTLDQTALQRKTVVVFAGSGGGAGGPNSGGAGGNGAGGRGGGGMYIECAGALNFTGTINSSGGAGVTGTGGSAGAGSGGGGAAGMVVIVYNTLTLNTGTITATGGAGATGGTGSGTTGNNGGGGGGAASPYGAGGAGGAASGAAGSAAGGAGAGGGGGAGLDGTGAGGAGGSGGATMGGFVLENKSVFY